MQILQVPPLLHVGVLHGALGRELHEWRTPQVADFPTSDHPGSQHPIPGRGMPWIQLAHSREIAFRAVGDRRN